MRRSAHAAWQVVDDPSGNKMLLVMEYMEGGPVMTREALERGRCIPEALALQYFRDMCKVRTMARLGAMVDPCAHDHSICAANIWCRHAYCCESLHLAGQNSNAVLKYR